MLRMIDGQTMLHRVYQQAVKANVFDAIIVATDDLRIFEHCGLWKMKAVMTSEQHISGTDRIAEVAEEYNADIIINIQGDEPFIEVECIQALVQLMMEENVEVGTLFKKIKNDEALFDFNVVKLVKDKSNKILYFSRQAIPAHRDSPYREWNKTITYYQHMGLYGFRKKTLMKLVRLKPGVLEIAERLEQLRWLENGQDIYGAEVESDSFGIDTEEDLKRAEEFYK